MILSDNFGTNQSREIDVRGTLNMHGKVHSVVWARLSNTTEPGQHVISVDTDIDWSPNDEIIITTTDRNIAHTERHRIDSIINRNTVRTVNPINYKHIAMTQRFSNRSVTVAAGVGLLTRNIKIVSNSRNSMLHGFLIKILRQQNALGFAFLSDIQFQTYGRFSSTYDENQSGILINGISTDDYSFYINRCSFDGGFSTA